MLTLTRCLALLFFAVLAFYLFFSVLPDSNKVYAAPWDLLGCVDEDTTGDTNPDQAAPLGTEILASDTQTGPAFSRIPTGGSDTKCPFANDFYFGPDVLNKPPSFYISVDLPLGYLGISATAKTKSGGSINWTPVNLSQIIITGLHATNYAQVDFVVRKIPPPGPFNLTASAGCTGIPGKQYVLLNWTASENVDPVNRPSTYDYYQVLRSENGGPFNPVTAQHLTTLSYRDEGIPSNKNYAYQVIAYNPNGFRFADPNPRDVPLQDCMAPPPVCS